MRLKYALILICALVAIACGSSHGPSAPTSTPPSTPAAAPTPAPTPTPTPSPSGFAFGPGQHRVGVTIAAGRYYSVPRSGCYWERLSGFGGTLGEILANDFIGFNAGQWIVDILPSDVGFNTEANCGSWYTTPRRGAQVSITPGVWLVGQQLAAGTYQANVRSGCYWERLRNFDGTFRAIIANDFVSTAGTRLVSISASDTGFSTDDDCGTWTSAAASTLSSLANPSLADIERAWRRHHQN